MEFKFKTVKESITYVIIEHIPNNKINRTESTSDFNISNSQAVLRRQVS